MYSFKIYCHFINSNYELTYVKSYKTKKSAMFAAEKLFNQSNISRVSLVRTPRGFYDLDNPSLVKTVFSWF